MTLEELQNLVARLQNGDVALEAVVERLLPAATPSTFETAAASVDLDRLRRCGYPEVVYSPGKTSQAIADVFHGLLAHGQSCLATRVSEEQAHELLEKFSAARHNPVARTIRIDVHSEKSPGQSADSVGRNGRVVVITAGTGDLPVAEEAAETARWMGCVVDVIVDVGVAGPHRLPAQRHRFEKADAIVVVAGMEGALPSVVGGYVACPVIAVPTSIGYGASFGGLAPLMGMLNSCAANVTVVNIDAGFKAGFVAGLIARQRPTD
ncbi:MAG TPA: nickel pincer cofactor biosynthesis protein LarB [Planctomycetaceae bacterium]|nr:nickel pincer cofactor biosynthesis protein LarB [Planctomycetaceae bacterium]